MCICNISNINKSIITIVRKVRSCNQKTIQEIIEELYGMIEVEKRNNSKFVDPFRVQTNSIRYGMISTGIKWND
jgi:hypothetical protein